MMDGQKNTIRTQPEVLEEIKKILWRHLDKKEYQAFIFGSYAQGKMRRSSDIDLGIVGKKAVPTMSLVEIEDDLEESDLPFMFDVVDFIKTGEGFKKQAMQQTIELN